MKKVLIIANLFHASPRIPGIIKYFSEFGWEPTVLSVSGDDPKSLINLPKEFKVRIITIDYRGDILSFWRKIFLFLGLKKEKSILNQLKEKTGINSQKSFFESLLNLYLAFFAYPDEEKKWIKPMLKKAEEILKKEKFNAVLSSSSPVSAHIIAKRIKEEYGLPWVADLRDLWSQNHNYAYPSIRRSFDRKLEIKTLAYADAIITVSDGLKKDLEDLHKKKKVFTVVSGFDPDIASENPAKLTSKFSITYTGQIYSLKQDPIKVLKAIKELCAEKKIEKEDIELRFFGQEYSWLKEEIKNNGLDLAAFQYGKVSPFESVNKQKESQILLSLNWEDKDQKGVYTGKVFEYLAVKRPIIATGGYGLDAVEELLEKTNAGVYAKSVEDIKQKINEFYIQFKRDGQVGYNANWSEVEKFSRKESAKKLIEILNQI